MTSDALNLLRSMPRIKSVGHVQIRDEDGNITSHETYPANFVFPKKHVIGWVAEGQTFCYSRVDSIKKTWKTMCRVAGIENAQLKDLRTYFNHHLTSEFGFSHKKAGAYIGNSERVNMEHYSLVSLEAVKKKLGSVNSRMELVQSQSSHSRGKTIKFPGMWPA